MIVASGTFATGTGTGDLAAQTPDLGGATPQAILFCHAGNNNATNRVWCIGAATATTERATGTSVIVDGAATTDTGHVLRDDAVLAMLNTTAAIDGLVDLAAVGADSFTPTIDDAFAASATIAYAAFAGLTDAEAATFALSASGDQTVGSSDWDAVIFFGTGAAVGAIAAQARIVVGFATATKNRCWVATAQDNVADTNNFSLISDDYCWAQLNAGTGAVVDGIRVNSLTGGIGLTRVAGTNTTNVGYLALKGVSADIIDSAMRTDTNNQTVTGASFTPEFLLSLLSPAATASDEATARTGMEGGIGWANGSAHYANWIGEADALAASDPFAAQSTTRMAIDRLISDGTSDEGDMSLVSFDSGGVTLDQDTAAAQATYMPLLLLGDEATASVAQTSTSLRRVTRRRR